MHRLTSHTWPSYSGPGHLTGWEAGQLEDELVSNAWLSVPADPQIIFDTPFELRWTAAAALLGVDITQMSTYAGHA